MINTVLLLERIRQSKTSLWETRFLEWVQGKIARAEAGKRGQVLRFLELWSILNFAQQGIGSWKRFKTSHSTVIIVHVPRLPDCLHGQLGEILLICGTETLSSHTRRYGWSSRIRKARGPTPQKGTESSHCLQRGTKLAPYVHEWWITGAQGKTKRNPRSPGSKKHESGRPAGLQLVGFAPNSHCRDPEPGLNAGYACRLTCEWLQKKPSIQKDNLPESGRSPGEGNGNPPQYSCGGNPMDRGVWWATVHGVGGVGHDLRLNHHHHPPKQKWSRQKRQLWGNPDKSW